MAPGSKRGLVLWRLQNPRYPVLEGHGPALFGGRWNLKGFSVVYATQTRAQACLDAFSRVPGEVGRNLALFRLHVPGTVRVLSLEVVVPPSAFGHPANWETQALGTGWVLAGQSCILRVPSRTVANASDYLVNPRHLDFRAITAGGPEGIPYRSVEEALRELQSEIPDARLLSPAQFRESKDEIRDVFICHASEDKRQVVDPLVAALKRAGITFWYDKEQIRWGDSVPRKIEEALSRSRFVIAVISKNFLKKTWPRKEMDAALMREITVGKTFVLSLLVGDREERREIVEALALQRDKRYEVWGGDPELVVAALSEALGNA